MSVSIIQSKIFQQITTSMKWYYFSYEIDVNCIDFPNLESVLGEELINKLFLGFLLTLKLCGYIKIRSNYIRLIFGQV